MPEDGENDIVEQIADKPEITEDSVHELYQRMYE